MTGGRERRVCLTPQGACGAVWRTAHARRIVSLDRPPGYLRLRGENYTDADLEAWAERMGSQGWWEAYVFFKHEEDGMAPQFALRLMEVMGALAPPAGGSGA
jgi:uncharacterized protein YecE (DUF72 family)